MNIKKFATIGLVITGILVGVGIGYWIYRPRISLISDSFPTPCDPLATTTDCSKIVDTPPSPAEVATTSANPVQSGKIDDHLTIYNTLRDVNFCGKIYRVKQVIIDGVDVVQRIAELATEKEITEKSSEHIITNAICLDITINMPSEEVYGPTVSKEMDVPKVTNFVNYLKHNMYMVFIANSEFLIDSMTQEIFVTSAIGSAPTLIGKLK